MREGPGELEDERKEENRETEGREEKRREEARRCVGATQLQGQLKGLGDLTSSFFSLLLSPFSLSS